MPLQPPLKWQSEVLLRTWEIPKRGLFASTRLGKSYVSIALDLLWRKHKGVRKSMISSLLTACPQWHGWLEDAGLTVYPAYRMSAEKIKTAIRSKEWDNGVLLINDDKLPLSVEELIRWEPEAFFVDESHRHRGVATKRSRAMRRLMWRAQFGRLLSGTPTPNHFGDLWAQMTALDRDDWGHSYRSFAERFLVLDAMFPSRVLAHKNVDELQRLILKWADVVRREDVYGPDHWQTIERVVEMPEQCWRLYNQLAKQWILDEPKLEVDNILVRMLRLQQIASGFLPDAAMADAERELHTAKIDACMADLSEVIASDEKAVVYHRFTREGQVLRDRIDGQYNNKTPNVFTFQINGKVPVQQRGELIRRFKETPGPIVAIVQTQSGGTGIDFSEASHVMKLSESFNADDEQQAIDRAYKQYEGKAIPRTVTHYRVGGTVDDYIAEILDGKIRIHDAMRNVDRIALCYGNIRRKGRAA